MTRIVNFKLIILRMKSPSGLIADGGF